MTLRITLAMACFLACANAPAQTEDTALSLSITPSLNSFPSTETHPASHLNAAQTADNTPPAQPAASTLAPPEEAPAAQPLTAEALQDKTPAKPAQNEPDQTLPLSASIPASNSALPVIELDNAPASREGVDLTRSTDDIIERLRKGFALADINTELVLHHQQWYLNRPDYMRRMVERSSRYLHHILEELEKRGMPTELALLPMVESAYNPMAYSRAKASGLWQFIPATGKRYNLDQTWWKDERRDIVASTTAALEYLQTIYEMHGDWHLALASYNWGEGAVGRAVNKNRAKGLPTDYLSLTMPNETRNYVPKLQALKNIFNSPALLAELDLPSIPNRPYFGTITKASHIDVKVAAQLAEMPVQEFVALNPSHNRPVIQSETPLIIPADKMDTFVSNLEAHEDKNKPLSSWQAYTMRPGDKLESIAPRFGMTVANLKAANGIKGRIQLPPGFTLLVAGKDGSDTLNMAALPEQPRLPDANPEPATKGTSGARTHTVRKGDKLPALAKRYGMSVAELKKMNNLRSDKLAAGSRLNVAAASAPAKTSVEKTGKAGSGSKETPQLASAKGKAPVAQSVQANSKKATKTTRYTIRRGDTLSSIARQFKVGKDDLLRWNRIAPDALTPGQTLTIQLAQNP